MPSHAERISLNGETAWLWQTKPGWSIVQGPYQIDLENCTEVDKVWHTVDWIDYCPRGAGFAGGLAKYEPGHMTREAFLEVANKLMAALRREERRGIPDLDQIRAAKEDGNTG